MIQNIYFFTEVIQLLIGICAVMIASKWRNQPGKQVFMGFVVIAFIVIPLLYFVFHFAMTFWLSRPGRSLVGQLFWIQPVIAVVLNMVAAMMLLSYVVIQARMSVGFDTRQGLDPDEMATAGSSRDIWARSHGPRWETNLSREDLVSIARRREWAFLIDFSPVFFLMIVIRISAWSVENEAIRPLATSLSMISLCSSPVVLLYWVLKDSCDGVSLGKLISGCRVVDRFLGLPIGAGSSIQRNILFLVPLFPVVELIVASVRKDGRRLGDLFANTMVVKGPPRWNHGIEVEVQDSKENEVASVHPLDD